MSSTREINDIDKDFLWIFNQIQRPAMLLSIDYSIVAITSGAESLLGSKKNILDKPITSLFEELGLEINLKKNKGKPVIKVSDQGIFSSSIIAKKILRLDWKLRGKKSKSGKIIGFILYVKEETDECLPQVYGAASAIQGETGACYVVSDYAKDTKKYLDSIISCMPGNVYWLDRNCVFLGCNENVVKFLGLNSREEYVGMTYEDVKRKVPWIVEHVGSWMKDDLEVMESGKPKLNVEEKPILLPNGKEVFFLTNRVPLFDKDKNVIGVVGVSIDITDRKLMEKKLGLARDRAEKAEKELLAEINQEVTGQVLDEDTPVSVYARNIRNYLWDIIECMPGNIYWMDKNCVYLGANDNTARFVGMKSGRDVAGKTYEEMEKLAGWPQGHADLWKKDDMEVIATGKPKLNVEEKPVMLPDGTEIYYLTSRVPIFDDEHNVIGVVGNSIDISDRKRAEKLEKEKDVAEKTSQLMKMLAGSIAHEIRTPLAIIGINLDLLDMNPDFVMYKEQEKGGVGKCLGNIRYAVKSAAYIVDNILTTLRTMSNGKLTENKFVKLSIADDIEKLQETYPFLRQEKLLLHVRLDKVKDFVYFGDRFLTRHVLFNLVKNALDAIKEAEKGEIEISLEEGKDFNMLKFKDTSLGISEENLNKIFDQFETVKRGGAGLGLAFCKMVMMSYNGDIVCDSKLGKYTEFTLTFPRPDVS